MRKVDLCSVTEGTEVILATSSDEKHPPENIIDGPAWRGRRGKSYSQTFHSKKSGQWRTHHFCLFLIFILYVGFAYMYGCADMFST
ncbi:intraflagellar transport protein 25 homolog isoform X1 [Mus musculus]|uniref:Hspb11 protein n=1 Tax=Mus musculus TaxID=10090 RepID=Q8VDG4_MOUSE|nr:intraflagellar transport protein 25 homolog isoform X1 [Mus musculus]AAH21897.1 Hspb11 protein [Mus musculus]|eukprot:XP_017175887.1 PREDICTED: intraflagellar transport protein 25 homolog isoform X3 [Mus musculus]